MLSIDFHLSEKVTPHILCLGAHSDDIEIGALATILSFADRHPEAHIDWVVFSATGSRRAEATDSAEYCTRGYRDANVQINEFQDGHFPMQAGAIKAEFESLKARCEPDLILTHYRHDRHQDHAVISDLTWQTFRNHLILEYETPKYDGDLGIPNLFNAVAQTLADQKIAVLDQFFVTQQKKSWFDPETFSALMRLRGIECHSESGYAEAFHCRKLLLR
ncbi:MAG: PIG-L deacetylase family protein [Pseudomonadales bacterium]